MVVPVTAEVMAQAGQVGVQTPVQRPFQPAHPPEAGRGVQELR
jgi:hypothetical protein